MTAVIAIAVLIGFVFGLTAGLVIAPAPRGEFRRYGARDFIGLSEAEAARIRGRLSRSRRETLAP